MNMQERLESTGLLVCDKCKKVFARMPRSLSADEKAVIEFIDRESKKHACTSANR